MVDGGTCDVSLTPDSRVLSSKETDESAAENARVTVGDDHSPESRDYTKVCDIENVSPTTEKSYNLLADTLCSPNETTLYHCDPTTTKIACGKEKFTARL